MIELVVVMIVLVLVAGSVVVFSGSNTIEDAKEKTTTLSMQEMKSTIMGHARFAGYVGDMILYPRPSTTAVGDGYRVDHTQVGFLFVNPDSYSSGVPESVSNTFSPATKRGWRGPYIESSSGIYAIDNSRGFTNFYGRNGDKIILDGWGNPIILQEPNGSAADKKAYTRLVSAGANGIIDTQLTDLMAGAPGDDYVLFLRQ
jgi:type II secretory pathway pseudopilin PulG